MDSSSFTWMTPEQLGDGIMVETVHVNKMPIFVICCHSGFLTVVNFSDEIEFTDCHDTCLTCSTLFKRPDECLSCPPTQTLTPQNTCLNNCHSTCSECVNPKKCDLCLLPGTIPNPFQSYCCPAYQYYNDLLAGCSNCHQSCNFCNAPSNKDCYNCRTGFVYDPLQQICKVECQQREFTIDNISCLACHGSCLTCDGSSLIDKCLTCDIGYELKNGKCLIICSESQFLNGALNTCEDCHVTCRKCLTGSLENQCIKCYPGMELVNGKCKNICKSQGEFRHFPSLDCRSCHSLCTFCTDSSVKHCTACTQSSILIPSLTYCQPICKTNEYPEEDQCKECHESCLTCSSSGPSSCTSCNTPL